MHEAISELAGPDHPPYTMTTEASPYTRKEFTSFEASDCEVPRSGTS